MVNSRLETEGEFLFVGGVYSDRLGQFTVAFGVWLWLGYGIGGGWLHAKLAVVAALLAYHFYCGKLLADFKLERNKRSHVWYRWFNEVPVIFLFAAVILVVLKPF